MSLADTVEVRAGLLAELPALLPADRKAFVLTDRNVAPLLPPSREDEALHVVPPGERSKSFLSLEALLYAMDGAGLDRDGLLVAVGGGVVTDLGGLAASLHRRGIAWYAVPTSLVGQVDAAVGGKTALNLGGSKNTVGTTHLPARVLVDPRALASLPRRHLLAGLAEVLKTALIAGAPLYERVQALAPDDLASATPAGAEVVHGCLRTKLGLVEEDLHDRGPRRLLNLGHTFGHAFEALALEPVGPAHAAPEPEDEPALHHGEAVGLGLLCAARAAHGAAGGPLETELRGLLEGWGLPVELPAELAGDAGSGREALLERLLGHLARDKKRVGGRHVLVLPRAPGRVEVVEGVPEAVVRAGLETVLPPA